MDYPVLIIHGWSAHSEGLEPLAAFLKDNGFEVIDIWLSDYLSMNDEITINDIGQAMGAALEHHGIMTPEEHRGPTADNEKKRFDVIVHSTGGLVVRQYLLHYFYGRPQDCPIQRLVMLAPANFGSPLARVGKTVLGRLRVGWKWDHSFESGTRVLDALELASPISWHMAQQDLFDPANKIFSPQHIYTTVLVGSDSYTGMAGAIHENGSDGTVRVSTANLNARSLKLIFHTDGKRPHVTEDPQCFDPIAFGVMFRKNHGTITDPYHTIDRDPSFQEILLDSLRIDSSDAYTAHCARLREITEKTFADGRADTDTKTAKKYHEYQHVVARVHDQFGEGIEDYMLEFFDEDDHSDEIMVTIQKEIIEKVKKNSRDKSYASFLFDITDLDTIIAQGNKIDMSISAKKLSEYIHYHDPEGYLTVASATETRLRNKNTTLFVDIELPRMQEPEVFTMRKY